MTVRPLSLPSELAPLRESYTYHSTKPSTQGPYMLGVDEAGRGPVLGPMVYGVAYSPLAWKDELEERGFADSKTLTHETRVRLLQSMAGDSENLGWAVRVLSPQDISSGMLRRPPDNLNRQAEDATVHLIRSVLAQGIQLAEVYVDALGNTKTYEARLSNMFPGILFTVVPKADAIYKIVGAASVAAKVTRDAWIEEWMYEEGDRPEGENIGSGYPSDPKTQAWLKIAMEPTFGLPSIARFSWSTVKVALDTQAHPVKWIDEGQASLVKSFVSATGREKGRCAVTRTFGLSSVADI